MDWLAALILGAAFIAGCVALMWGITAAASEFRLALEPVTGVLRHWLEAVRPLPDPEDTKEPTRLGLWLDGVGLEYDDETRDDVIWAYRVLVEKDAALKKRTAEEQGWDEDVAKQADGAAWQLLRAHGLLGNPS